MRSAQTIGFDRPLRTISKRRRAQRGVATVEAVIMLPLLGLLLVGTLFMRERYLAQQQAMLHARRCAWEYAMAACQGERSTECQGGEGTRELAEDAAAEGTKVMDDARLQGGSPRDIFEDVPILGDAIKGLLGAKTSFLATTDVPVPWLEKTTVPASAQFVTLCNEKTRDGEDVVKDVMCGVFPPACE